MNLPYLNHLRVSKRKGLFCVILKPGNQELHASSVCVFCSGQKQNRLFVHLVLLRCSFVVVSVEVTIVRQIQDSNYLFLPFVCLIRA